MPLDIIEEARKNFDERLEKINWDIYYKDLPFNPSALSLKFFLASSIISKGILFEISSSNILLKISLAFSIS